MTIEQDEFLEQLQEVDSHEFEKFVAKLWELQNWNTYVTKDSGDGGIDVIAEQTTPFPKKEVMQVKRYNPSKSVGRPDIQQYSSIRQERTDVDTVVVVTTGQFTEGAKNVAKKLNVKLVDGSQLYNLIEALDAFQLAQSYIDPEAEQNGMVHSDTEASSTNVPSQKRNATEDLQSVTEFDNDTQLENIPTYLPSLIKLRREITNDIRHFRSILASAEKSYHKERYFEAVEEYERVNRRRIDLRQEIARYDAGLTRIDSDTARQLPSTETFTTELAQLTEGVDEQFKKAFQIAERAKGLDLLAEEISDRVDSVRSRIETGDQMRQSGRIERAHSKYNQAKDRLEDVKKTMEMYEDLLTVHDDAVVESHQGPLQDGLLTQIETEVTNKINSKSEHLEIPSIAEDAVGSFNVELLTDNNGELFDKDLIEYIEDEEKLEFVFVPPRKGFTIASSDSTKEVPQHDTLESGASFLLVTDQRILYVAGVNDHDETRSIGYDKIADVVAATDVNPPTLQFTTIDGTGYKFAGIRNNESDLGSAAEYISQYSKE
ncbi:restriction endonuclease [Salinibaculum rarum]|uniref:restriction endonuclease n=1 Tax=Salinibaculum rarum TaxID=3058903 RepID=UPI00265FF809|nr:restriction endonuclease [Salinibaculum sp. KK48]